MRILSPPLSGALIPHGMFDVLCLMPVSLLQGYGWLSPTVGALEFSQCLTRALTTSARKALVQTQKVCQAPSKVSPTNQPLPAVACHQVAAQELCADARGSAREGSLAFQTGI